MFNTWDTEGPRLKQLAESAGSILELSEVVLEASGIASGLESANLPRQLRWAALAFANCVYRVDRQHWFLIIARYIAEKTLEEIATPLGITRQRVSQLLLRESDKVFADFSAEVPLEAGGSTSALAGSGPWVLPSWVHSISSIQSASQRVAAAIIFENLIFAANAELPQGEVSPWRPFVISGLIPSSDLLGTRRKPHDGYLLPGWISTLKKRISKSDEVVYWHTSARGPVPARGTGGLEIERPEILAMLTWADLVQCDASGPKSAVIMLRNEVDSAQLELRLCAGMMTGRLIPTPILVVLPSTGRVGELNWSSLDMEGMELDATIINDMNSYTREAADGNQRELIPSAVQEVWHVHEGNLPEVMGLVDSDLRQNDSINTLLWGRYRPLIYDGAIKLIRI